MDLVSIPQNPMPPGAALAGPSIAGVTLRVAHWLPAPGEPCRGTVVILPGRGEFIEKYAETVADLRARGFAALAFDWRGQGGSSRLLPDPRRGHVRHFDDYRADLDAVAREILVPLCPRPFIALAHSMGGAIVVDHAIRGAGLFDRIVLSAPMLDLYGLALPRVVRGLAAVLSAVGRDSAYIPGGSGHSWMTTRPFEGNGLTSDPVRYGMMTAMAQAAPHLVIGAPTFGWLNAAFKVMDGLATSPALEAIGTPVLAVTCAADRVVDSRATQRLVARMPHGRSILVPGALHEILMERDPLRGQFWTAFDTFLADMA